MHAQIPLKIWLLCADGANKYMSLVGHPAPDVSPIFENFSGHPMPDDWVLPPLVILGKSKKLGDFVGWVLNVPIVSQRAKDILEPIVGDAVQFLRFHEIRGKKYYAMNVLQIEDYLDNERSAGQRNSEGILFTYHRYVFRDLPDEMPPIFKVTPMSEVFVTECIARAIVDNKLTGACLQDPGESGITLLAQGKPLNVYPGIF